MAFGLLVFLLFLMFAAQLLIGLYVRTVAMDAAMLGAQRMARQATPADAHADVAQLVGRALVSAEPVAAADDPLADPDYVRYRVVVQPPVLLRPPVIGGWMTDPVPRDARARIERRR
jgi:hypothetical protein